MHGWNYSEQCTNPAIKFQIQTDSEADILLCQENRKSLGEE